MVVKTDNRTLAQWTEIKSVFQFHHFKNNVGGLLLFFSVPVSDSRAHVEFTCPVTFVFPNMWHLLTFLVFQELDTCEEY